MISSPIEVDRCARTQGSVVYLGTIKLDLVAALSMNEFNHQSDVYELADIAYEIGGTAVNFAKAATGLFERLTILGAVGDDFMTGAALDAVQAICDTALVYQCENRQNAVVMNIRDAPDSAGVSARLLISTADAPHMHLPIHHVLSCRSQIAAADALVADGYLLQGATSREALRIALDLARASGKTTVLDLVPHNISQSITLRAIKPVLDLCEMIVAEARTVIGVACGRWPISYEHDEQLVSDAVTWAKRLSPSATWHLRYGYANIENTLIIGPHGPPVSYRSTYRSATVKKAFGDRLMARDVYNYLIANASTPAIASAENLI